MYLNKNMNKKKSATFVLLLFFQSLVFQIDIPHVILCFGDDGHISLEKSNNIICEHNSNPDLSRIIYENKIKATHGDCTDINLDLHFSYPNIQKNKSSIITAQLISYLPFFTKPTIRYSDFTAKNNLALSSQSTEKISNTVLQI